MKKKYYQKPTMNIVKLQHRSQILAGSVQSKSNTVEDYNWNTEVEEKQTH